jgi:hypothetical protein
MFLISPDLDFIPIPDPGTTGQKAPDPGSRIRNTEAMFLRKETIGKTNVK